MFNISYGIKAVITFTIAARDPSFRDEKLLAELHAAIVTEMKKKQGLLWYCFDKAATGLEFSIGMNQVIINKFDGLLPDPDENHRHEIYNYLVNEFMEIFYKLGIHHAFHISSYGCEPENNPFFIKLEDHLSAETRNHKLLNEFVADSDIPEEFRCAITQQIMDSPVSLRGAPGRYYEKSHLKRYLYTRQEKDQLGPFTRVKVDPFSDMISESALKQRINEYAKQRMAEVLKSRAQLTATVREKYSVEHYPKSEHLHSAFRQAAAANDLDAAVVFIENYAVNINAADSNPASKKTALHHAVYAGHHDMVELLVKSGARTSEMDASGKSLIVYALEKGDARLIKILLGNIDLTKLQKAAHVVTKKM